MDDSILPLLERAELAARETGLVAAAEADRIEEAARAEAAALEAAVPARIERSIAERRETLLSAARVEAAALEAAARQADAAEADAREGGDDTTPDLSPAGASFERAVERIVAAVLGEDAHGRA